MINCASNH